ncbi:OmpA family protein [Flavobacteriaceae bacterium R38]|nr:OmpA family protein [Flavobacteriaceae bacterium R38]
MKHMKQTLILLSLLIVSFYTYGQSKYKSANKNFDRLWYKEAAAQYETAIRRGDDSKEVLQKVADAYYFNTDMENASKWYGLLFSKYEDILEPEYAFRYIHSLQGVGNYRLAKGLMKIYSEKINNAQFRVDHLAENDNSLDILLERQPEFYITHLSINTKFSDFGTAFYDDKIVFASTRDTAITHTRIYKWNNQPYLNLFLADTIQDGRDLKNLELFSDAINTKYHEAMVAFNKEKNVMYFTRNNFQDKNLSRDGEGTNHLKLYKATLKNNEWTAITALPFNSESYSVGHPTISPDGKRLYFVSDMPGTLGATDIFMVEIYDDGSYSNAKNLGPKINTSGREMFPFITDDKLYFSSDGHLGLGGLDVFESSYKDTYSKPINLGKPLNSNRDDFAYIVNEETQRGYFSSNRIGGNGDDDIYSFQRIQLSCSQRVVGTVVNEQNGIPEDNVTVNLISKDASVLATTSTNINGEYFFDLTVDCDEKYTVEVTKDGFDPSKKSFVSTSVNEALNRIPLGIKKRNKLIVKEDGVLKIKIGIIYFDFDKSDIRNQAAIELNKVVMLMNEYPQMVIKIESHTDSRGNDDYNEKLSDRRAKATRDYIVSQGINANRIESAIGYGEKQLINDCANGVECQNAKHDLNRRSEFIILKLN